MDALLFKPIFNVLTFLYAIIPGHNYGLAIILFTIITRLLLWPLVKKQLHHAKAMRKMAPELKRIKKEAAGDKQKESMLVMALYKEKEINPLAPIGILIVQLPIIIGLYSALNKIVKDPHQIVSRSYDFIQNMPAIKELAADITKLDNTLFGFVDLSKPAIGQTVQWSALLIVLGGAVMQYFQSKQISATAKTDKNLRQIFRDTASGKEVDQTEVTAAITKNTRFIFPVFLFLVTMNIASGLSLYIFVSGLVAYLQQAYILKQDEEELESTVDNLPVEAEIIKKPSSKKQNKTKSVSATKATVNKRRR